MLRRAGLEVIVASSHDGSWIIHAEPPQGMRHKGDEKLAQRIAERVATEAPHDP